MNEDKDMSVEGLEEKFNNKWVLVEILEENELERSVKVNLIIRSKNRAEFMKF